MVYSTVIRERLGMEWIDTITYLIHWAMYMYTAIVKMDIHTISCPACEMQYILNVLTSEKS